MNSFLHGVSIKYIRDSPDCHKAIPFDQQKSYKLAVLSFLAVLTVFAKLAVFAILAALAVMAILQPITVCSSLFQTIPSDTAYSSVFQPIPAYSSLLQHILA